MAAVMLFGALFVLGVIALGILQSVVDRLAKPLELPMDTVQALFIGAGYLITLPFVLSILAETHVSILASLIVGALILLGAGASFAYAMFRLMFPAKRLALARH